MAGMSISPSLFSHLTTCLGLGLAEQLGAPARRARHGINASCDTGFVTPALAIAAWEALLHEVMLSDFPKMVHHHNHLWKIPESIINHWSIKDKTLIVPDFLFGATFEKGSQPYQDFCVLVSIRNEFVHFKNSSAAPLKKLMKEMEARGLLLKADRPPDIPDEAECDYPWPCKVACTEMVRWEINTIADMADKLASFIVDKDSYTISLCKNFRRVEESWVRQWYAEHGIDIG